MLKYISRTFIFLLLFVTAYLGGAAVLSLVSVSDRPAMKIATRNPVIPGDFGFTLARYEDIENYKDVDLVFIGSSHCYRTFDTRIYEAADISAFNMGTTGQAPLNSYYLLEAYFDQLQPEVVVFDLNYRVIDRDGLECYYDLATNVPYHTNFWNMAFSINNPHAINETASNMILDFFDKAPEYEQKDRDGEKYIPGGYVEFTKYLAFDEATYEEPWPENDAQKYQPRTVIADKQQLAYIEKTVRYVQKKGAQIVLITKPEPHENLKVIANYDEIAGHFSEIAQKLNVPYYDFNKISLPLKSSKHFHDKEYLNPFGVKIFNPALISLLREKQILKK